jgi:vacuolar-type H+-ATPase subunit I/STV1
MPELSVSNLLLFAAFVVPGAVSLQVYRLKVSTPHQTLKENLIESVVFSVVNFALLYWLIVYAISDEIIREHPLQSYGIIVFSFFVAPAVWPFLLVTILRRLEGLRLIQPQANTSWDYYFNQLRRGSYVIVHLHDGSYVGGKFDEASYASGYPDSGHLFLEELWEVGNDGNFTGKALTGQGVILRPTDYKYVRVST